MLLGQIMKSIFQPEIEGDTSHVNNRINFSDSFYSPPPLKVKHEHGYCKFKSVLS